jgi:hypothetical protein
MNRLTSLSGGFLFVYGRNLEEIDGLELDLLFFQQKEFESPRVRMVSVSVEKFLNSTKILV